ncbi:hypothetical protein TB2_028692 [Malus domestica]
MDPLSAISEELAEIDGQIADIFRALSNGFQKLEKIQDSNRQSRQLEELTDKMRDCKRLIKEFDREVKNMERINDPNTSRMLNEKKQSMIKELNSYVALKKQYASNLENKKIDLFDMPAEDFGEQNVLLASARRLPRAKEAAFLRDLEELQSHMRVVVEDLQDAEALCDLASSEKHGWKVEILINDDNSGNFKREVHDAGQRVGIEVTPEKKQH